MNSNSLERPSIAKEFYLKITRDSDPGAAIKRLVNAASPVFESEWLEFKGVAKNSPQVIQEKWSIALAGFANTQGGVLIWGIDARKDTNTGIDAAGALSLVKDPEALKSRLNELHHQATEPPVLGVEIEAYPADGGSGEGFVVCFIPESSFKPHRAEHASRQYYIRAGDDFVVPSVSLLRNLFFPQCRCLLVPTFAARLDLKSTQIYIDGLLTNIGSATAFDTVVITHSDPIGLSYRVAGWDSALVPCHSRTTLPIHPGVTARFFSTALSSQILATFKVQIFAQDTEPTEWLIEFTEAEMKTGARKSGQRRSLYIRNG